LAPTPIASDSIATEAKPGLARKEVFEPLKAPRGACIFRHAGARSELATGSVDGLGSRESLALELLGPRLDVELDLIVQFPIELRAPAEVECPSQDFFQRVHAVLMTL
jgi:hypothetical protein